MSRTGHDERYKRLFSDPIIVAQLISEFVSGPWISEFDLEAMVPLPTEFHAAGKRRDGDKIWRIPRHDGTSAYLVLLLEFQSTSDRYMALRVNTYTCLLWQQLITERQLMPNGELPPILPVVLHNGDGRWRAPLAMKDLIGLPQGSPLWQWQPNMDYYLIDIGAFSKTELNTRTGLPALWFRLENAQNEGEIRSAAKEALALVAGHPEFSEVRKLFEEFVGAALAPNDPDFHIPDEWLKEEDNMLLTRAREWEQEWRKDGEAALLLRLLERRFGALPVWVARQVSAADTDTLEEWGLRILEATCLEDVITERPA